MFALGFAKPQASFTRNLIKLTFASAMPCVVLAVDSHAPDRAAIAQAAAVLCSGGLVAFPTETVYGLGANALDPAAVAKIFAAKGRAATNPLIVHVPDIEAARALVADWPSEAQRLAERFWPGPLTLVLPRRSVVPDIVTAGGPTVAVRVPAHPVALALLRACRLPLAAPSANRSTQLSPTRAEHVLSGLADRIDLLLDAGPTPGGLESTVVDVTAAPPRLLRPGLVTLAQFEAVVGSIAQLAAPATEPLRSPGLSAKHYAPRTRLELADDGAARVRLLVSQGLRVGWVAFARSDVDVGRAAAVVRMPEDVEAYSAQLYATLHSLDAQGLDCIVVDLPPASDAWLAVHDRLQRAAHADV
jgi:L-threonylcarbamoyladenylate synthase